VCLHVCAGRKAFCTAYCLRLPNVLPLPAPPPPHHPTRHSTEMQRWHVQEVGVHVIAPAAALAADPLPGAVALRPLSALAAGTTQLPEGAARLAVSVDGTESEADVELLKVRNVTKRHFVSVPESLRL
jgi:hypothetical protein